MGDPKNQKMMLSIDDFYKELFKDCRIKYEAMEKYKTIETFGMFHESSLLLVVAAMQTGEIYRNLLRIVRIYKEIMDDARSKNSGIIFPDGAEEIEEEAIEAIENDLKEIKKIEL